MTPTDVEIEGIAEPSLLTSGTSSFSIQWEMFCAEVACGATAKQAAESVGYTDTYASNLRQHPAVQQRIKQLIAERVREGGIVSKVWAECKLVWIANRCLAGRPAILDESGKTLVPAVDPDYSQAQSAIMNLARLRGWIIERKQSLNAKVDLGKSDLESMLDQQLANLPAEARARVRQLANDTDQAPDKPLKRVKARDPKPAV